MYTAAEVAVKIGVPYGTLMSAVSSLRLAAPTGPKVGKRQFFNEADVVAYRAYFADPRKPGKRPIVCEAD